MTRGHCDQIVKVDVLDIARFIYFNLYNICHNGDF